MLLPNVPDGVEVGGLLERGDHSKGKQEGLVRKGVLNRGSLHVCILFPCGFNTVLILLY